MEIRIATTQDINAICALYEQLYDASAQLQPDYWRSASANRRFIHSTIHNHDSDVLLAMKNGIVGGFALVQQEKTSPYECVVPHEYALLTDIVVDESLREQGIGSALLESVRLWAKNRQLDYVELNVLPENTEALHLYQQHQYQTVMHRMRLPLKRAKKNQ